MRIAIIADDNRKELMAQFCIAYCGILSKHILCATVGTGKYIEEASGLKFELMLTGKAGGLEIVESRLAYDEIDIVLYFRDQDGRSAEMLRDDANLLRMCDKHNVLVATNIATAEVIIMALEAGDLDYREFINPLSRYNQSKK